eukprot:TRINITY_DN7150_c0_g1_i1.p1 TRINITY_DN7150_c0_g1~~TRINITY_DN7150_c0_g1_i1.p1  ORF type:complete len:168 (-),score=3.02 TRINITY_DN7150_c0_g1_i1:153-656(-)
MGAVQSLASVAFRRENQTLEKIRPIYVGLGLGLFALGAVNLLEYVMFPDIFATWPQLILALVTLSLAGGAVLVANRLTSKPMIVTLCTLFLARTGFFIWTQYVLLTDKDTKALLAVLTYDKYLVDIGLFCQCGVSVLFLYFTFLLFRACDEPSKPSAQYATLEANNV